MRKFSCWSLWLLVSIMLFLAACDQVQNNPPAPSEVQTNSVLALPTRTLGPIVSFTPPFTATPIPSATFTPSETSPPTNTSPPPTLPPTQSPTPTPTIEGVIRSTKNVNLREGPGTHYDIVASVQPGVSLGVLGYQTDVLNREWYKVAYTTDEGDIQQLWVFANLVTTDFDDIIRVQVTPTPDTTRTPVPTPDTRRVDILAYCQQKGIRPPRITSDDKVYIEWSWFVARAEYMEQHLENAEYAIRLDGDLLENWQQYATEMQQESGQWIVYWYYPVGQLSTGEHKIDFRLTWDESISDGYKQFGPGTPNETDAGTCSFTVIES